MAKITTRSREVVGVVFGGGQGTRLRPLTNETSKQLLPIGEMPMISRVILQLSKAGLKDILLLIDQRHASQYMNQLQDGANLGLRSLSYIWQPPEGIGLPSALAKVAPQIGGRSIVAACGDVLVENDLTSSVEEFMFQRVGARILGAHMEDSAGYSPLVVEDNRVLEILDKDPNRHTPSIVDIGTYMYPPDVFMRANALTPSARGETEIWDLNRSYANESSLYCSVTSGWWSDAGSSITAYQEAHERYS